MLITVLVLAGASCAAVAGLVGWQAGRKCAAERADAVCWKYDQEAEKRELKAAALRWFRRQCGILDGLSCDYEHMEIDYGK